MIWRVKLLAIMLVCIPIKLLPDTDSLTNIINNSKGPDRINARLEYAQLAAQTDFDGALQNTRIALEESLLLDNFGLAAKSQFQIAKIFIANHNRDSAEIYLNLALPLAKTQGEFNLISEIQIELGKSCQYRGDDIHAMQYYNEAIESAEKVDNHRLLGACYSSIGNIFRVLGAHDEALASIIRAKSNYELADFEEGAAWISYTLGRLYRNLGIINEAQKSFYESLNVYTTIAEVNGDSLGIALCLEQLGMLDLEQNNLEAANTTIQRALDIYTELQSVYGISNAWKNLGKIAYALGDYAKAKVLLQQSLDYKYQMDVLGLPGIYETMGMVLLAEDQWQAGIDTLKIGVDKAASNSQHQIQYNIYGRLAHAYEDNHNLSEALKYYKLQFGLQNLIVSNPVQFKLPELRGIYEMEQNRQQIKTLNQKNQIISLELVQQQMIQWGFSVGVIFLLIFSGLIYRKNRAIRAINKENETLIVKLQQEINQRRQAEKELKESDSLRELLLDIITHDLKNPVSTIYSMSEMAFDKFPENEYLEIIYLSSAKLLEVLKNTTFLSQATFGEQIPKEKLDLAELLNGIVKEYSGYLQEVEMDLELNIPKDLTITANPLIAEVFKNYISNALKYASEGKRIVIETLREENAIVICVKDFGKTIAKADRSAIFVRQTQLDGKKGGRGLGLAIVKRIATAHDGEAWLEPNLPVGNSFCIRIPL